MHAAPPAIEAPTGEVVAHKGLHTRVPENSLAAIEAALRAGLHHVEVDVRVARDGTLYLLHDATLNRTTNTRGRLASLNAERVRAVRLRDGSTLPRLEEALDLCADAMLYLDVKEADAARSLAALLPRYRHRVEVWANSRTLIQAALVAGCSAALISHGLFRCIEELITQAREAGASALSFYPADLEPRVASSCRAADMPFQSGTPNDLPTWRYLVEQGARAIITDRPLECRAWLEERNASNRVRSETRVAPAV